MSFITIFLALIFSFPLFADEVGLLFGRIETENLRDEMIRKETKEIRISTFILDLDDHGRKTLGLLVDAAKRGVKVKLNIDGLMRGLPGQLTMLRALEDTGVEVKVFNPMVRNAHSLNLRNHMKALITSDGMIVGGRNITSEYFQRGSRNNYHDTDVFVRGSQVREATTHFDEVFSSPQMRKPAGNISPDRLREARAQLERWRLNADTSSKSISPKATIETSQVRYVADPAGGNLAKRASGMHRDIIDMINRSRVSLEFTNPYVLPTKELKEALQNALDRGVKIRINSNSAATTDTRLMAIAWDVKKQELMDMGIEVNELKPGQFLHSKTIVRDGEEVYIGSFNLDPRSQNLNMENGVIVTNRRLATQMTRQNDRMVKYFMSPAERKAPVSSLPALQRPGECMKRSLHQIITGTLFPVL